MDASDPQSPLDPEIAPQRLAQLQEQRAISYRTAIWLLVPIMVYVSYQLSTKVPVQNAPGLMPISATLDPASTPQPGDSPNSGIRLDPNTATWSELTVIPGIGEITAKKIVAYREEHAAPDRPVFRCAADLDAVHGIGPKTVQKMIPFLSIPIHCDELNTR